MDEILGTIITVAASATRIKLFRKDEFNVNVYAKARYAERPDKISLVWKYPLLEVQPSILKPSEESKKAILEFLKNNGQVEHPFARDRTFRVAYGNGRVQLERQLKHRLQLRRASMAPLM
jgi:hypothetical protein